MNFISDSAHQTAEQQTAEHPGFTDFIRSAMHSDINFFPLPNNNSLNSFVFKYSIDEQHYLIKVVFISNTSEKLKRYNGSDKKTVLKDRFIDEFLAQDMVYKSTENGRMPICPRVFTYGFLTKEEDKNLFLSKINREYSQVTSYFLKYPKYELGIMVQEFINGESLQSIYNNNDETIPPHIRISVGAQLLRLLLDCGVVHLDLRLDNILILDGNCYIIDFGIFQNVQLETPDIPPSNLVKFALDSIFKFDKERKMRNPRFVELENKRISLDDARRKITEILDNDMTNKDTIKLINQHKALTEQIYELGEEIEGVIEPQFTELYRQLNKSVLFPKIYEKYIEYQNADMAVPSTSMAVPSTTSKKDVKKKTTITKIKPPIKLSTKKGGSTKRKKTKKRHRK